MTESLAWSEKELAFGPFRLLVTERLLKKQNEPVALGSRALDILIALTERAGDVIEKKELIARVWPNVTVDDSGLRVHLTSLRKALGDGGGDSRYIVNIPGRGYCFVAPIIREENGNAAPVASAGQKLQRSGRLPPRLARMLGRDDLIAELSDRANDQRVITIHGPGGIGKTTVAVALGHALRIRFEEAVYFVDLGLTNDASLVPSSIASVLGMSVQSSDPKSAIVNFLRDRRMLLVLDSCEHLVDEIAGLAERIVQEAPQVRILTTSREPLRIEGEHVHRLAPLQSPPEHQTLTADQARTFPAAHLLIERAIAGNHRIKFDDADAILVGEICRKLDGMALAIELAAGRISTHGLQDTAATLHKRMNLNWRGRRTALPRHQTMMAMLDWSHDLLNQGERAVLRHLSIFVGTFSLEAAQAVAWNNDRDIVDVADALDQLVEKSLVSTIPGMGNHIRYRLLDTTRAYARSKLDELGETASANERHARYWLRCLDPDVASGVASQQIEDDEVYRPDIGNIRAALEFSLTQGGLEDLGVSLAAVTARVFTSLSLLSECYQWTGRGLACLSDGMSGSVYEMQLQAAFGHAMMFTRGNSNRALGALNRGLQIAEKLGDLFYQFRLLSDLHMFRLRTGRFSDTLSLAIRANNVAEEIGDPVGLAASHRLLSTSHHLAGNQAEARAHLESWQPPPSQIADTSAFNAGRVPRIGFSRMLWLLGCPEQAVRAAEKADQEAINVKSPVPVCIVTIWGANVYGWIGDWDTVDARADRLIAYAREYSLDPHIAVGFGIKGAVLISRGQPKQGVELLKDSLAKLRADRYELYAPGLGLALAEGLGTMGRVDEGLTVVNETIAILNSNGGSLDFPEQMRVKGTLLMQAGDLSGAEESLRQSLDLAERQSALSWKLRAAMSLFRLQQRQGDSTEAYDVVVGTYDRFTEGFGTTDLVAAKRMIASLS